MTIRTLSKTRKATLLAAGMAGLLLAVMLTACKSAPNLTGRWFATGKTLANGEQQKAILDLKQDGNQLTGNVRAHLTVLVLSRRPAPTSRNVPSPPMAMTHL